MDLALARTMLHESAHAYLVRYFDSNPAAANKTYAELLEFYDQKGKLEPAHHETFVNTFVQQIAGALSKYGDSKNYKFASADEKRQFYQNMAWGGLHTTEDYTQLMPSRPYPPQYIKALWKRCNLNNTIKSLVTLQTLKRALN